ncbi:MAG: GDYXXLXY domain-containing protein [Betaproteobacteria bacterium]|nr:GDYXXLXY domain-containing protein [Betaproteobacteria bacterium]
MSLSRANPRVLVAVLAGILILALLNGNILQKERLIEQGRAILLQLAPVDPRSLMQGDYMALRFALANELRDKASRGEMLILKLDENNVAHFERIDEGHSVLQADEIRFRYRLPNAFFLEEGQGKIYESARYGEFRVADDGSAVLTQLRDSAFNVPSRSAAPD